jgi:hypothetical protein
MSTRPVGSRIIEILELLEEHGDLTYSELWAHMEGIDVKTASCYARRAEKLGLLVASQDRPSKFSTVADWRKSPLMPKSKPAQAKTFRTPSANFIFNQGAI